MQNILLIFILFIAGCNNNSNGKVVDKNESEINCTFTSNEPLAKYQWYLQNLALSPQTSVNNLVEGEDIHLCNLSGGKKEVVVSVVDVGVEAEHEDLKANIDLNRSFRFSDGSHDSTPVSKSSSAKAHGTACAGIIAASENGLGVRGVAPNVTLVGLNAGDLSSDSDIAESLSWQGVDVSSNSWGSPDFFDESSSIEAIEEGIYFGREGNGTNYVFAPGNSNENSEFQSIMSSGYVIPVSALDGAGKLTSYSAIGANVLVCAYGGAINGAQEPAIVTTDFMGLKVGLDSERTDRFEVEGNEKGNYTRKMNGTSAAAPMVSGVIALMLSENPNLTYRDVRYILATTARKNDVDSVSWFSNGASLKVSNDYGFGVVDAYAAVQKSKTFVSLGAEEKIVSSLEVNESISNEIEKSFTIDKNLSVEFVQLELDLEHKDFKNLKISLLSPSDTQSVLVSPSNTTSSKFVSPWIFASVQFLDESSKGTWKVKIANEGSSVDESVLHSVKLIIKGHNDE